MNDHEQLESALIDLIDERLSAEAAQALRQRIATEPAVKQLHDQLREVLAALDAVNEEQPAPAVRSRFQSALLQEVAAQGRTRLLTPWVWRAAAAVLIVVGGALVWQWNAQQQQLQALREEMLQTRQLLLAQLRNTQSASQRIDGATVAYSFAQPDDEIVQALVNALNTDRNTNVRLAALEALGKFYQEATVRQELVAALATQNDPVVQIALIQLLVQMKEQEVTDELQKIIEDSGTLQPVRDEAHRALLKLS